MLCWHTFVPEHPYIHAIVAKVSPSMFLFNCKVLQIQKFEQRQFQCTDNQNGALQFTTDSVKDTKHNGLQYGAKRRLIAQYRNLKFDSGLLDSGKHPSHSHTVVTNLPDTRLVGYIYYMIIYMYRVGLYVVG